MAKNPKLKKKSQFITGNDKVSFWKKLSKHKIVIVLVLVVIAIIVVAGILISRHRKHIAATNQCNNSNNSPIYGEAGNAIATKNLKKLQPVVTKIEKQSNYAKDPNCLYPLVVYNINIGDAVTAQKFYSELQGTGNVNLAPVYQNLYSMDELKSQLDNLRVDQQNFNKVSQSLSGPGFVGGKK